ncbi:MAG: LCP family protein [Herbinix sp.]|nr:LCP family protein [Herbinix sp.]
MAKSKKKKSKSRLIFIVLSELFVILLLIVGFYIYKKMDKLQYDNSQDENIQQNEEVEIGGYRNIALFGVDSRKNALEKSTHSDTIVIASINNETKDVKLASIYRDTYVKIPDDNEFDKMNAAYFRGGYSLALSTLNKNFDLDVKEYVTVNFQAVVNAIDLLGGITIDVQENEVKYVNGYTRELNRINGTDVAGIKSAGTQVLNGTQATAYARIRYTAGGDYKRTERQRIVIEKVFKKLKDADLKTVNAFINDVFPDIYTNLTKAELLSLAKDILSYNIVDQTGFPFEPDAHTYHKVSYVFPVDLAANVIKLHEFLFDEAEYVPSSTVQDYSDEIESIRK